jgi:hypothetical protein
MGGALYVTVDERGVSADALRAIELVAREFPGDDRLVVRFAAPGCRASRLTIGRQVDSDSRELRAAVDRIVRTYRRPPGPST